MSSSRLDSQDLGIKEASMDANKFKGSWHQFKGELKKKWGQLTDDDLFVVALALEKIIVR